ncbi:MAG: TolC family protein [Pseudomonadales bacterium]|nr:TolC family protein [Pseudomonadales bacterium]
MSTRSPGWTKKGTTAAWYLLAGLLMLTGCTASFDRRAADRASYNLIAEKARDVPGMSTDVDIDNKTVIDLSPYPRNDQSFDFLGSYADNEVGARIISLEAALDLAFAHNRDYQLQRERLYLQALSLTLDRYLYTPIFSATANGTYDWDESNEFVQDVQTLVQEPSGGFVTDETFSGRASTGGRFLLRSGGTIALNLTSNLTRFLTGNMDENTSSALIGSFTQPLLRGAGSRVAAENLLQAERDLLYQLREFTRFRQQLSVRIATQYYNVLQSRDVVRNNFLGLNAVQLSLERERAFQAEGLRTPGQVGRLEQSALQRDLSWVRSITRYTNGLDTLKIQLGLRTDEDIMLDDAEMLAVAEAGMVSPDLDMETALELAVANRLDLFTEVDQIQDRARKVEVAANNLLPGLNLVLNASVPGPDNAIGNLDFRLTDYQAGIEIDLPVDRMSERNAHRRALIDLEAAIRSYELAVDSVKLEVLNAWRDMQEAERDFEISQSSVEINERRVEEAELRAELGLGDIQDTVDAQNDLTNARTALSGAIVNHNVAKLALWRDIGLLYVDEQGQWEEGINAR